MKPTVPDDGALQQQIGTAYDVVKSVADNLPEILQLAEDFDTFQTTYVQKTRTINGKSLATDIELTPADVDAQPADTKLDTFNTNVLSASLGFFKKTASGVWSFASLLDTDVPNLNASKITAGTLPVARGGTGVSTITGLVKGNGTTAFTAAVAGTDYVIPSGSITGNAGTATTLATSRTFTIGSTGKSFNGSANVSWTLSEIGAQAVNANLTSLSGLSGIADRIAYFNGPNTLILATFTAFGRSIVAAADATTVSNLLGVQTKVDQDLRAELFTRMNLDLDFVEGVYKEYRGKYLYRLPLMEVLNCTRTSTAVETGPLGFNTYDPNEPRIRHNLFTGKRMGLVSEPPSTNFVTDSENFTAASWTKSGVTVQSNAVLAPNGQLVATKLIESAIDEGHAISDIIAVIVGLQYTYSIFLKAGERNSVRLSCYNASGDAELAIFDLLAGTITAQTAQSASLPAKIENYGNGWYRCSIVCQNDTDASSTVSVNVMTAGNPTTYQGDGVSGLYVWGAQFELGKAVTSYIPTAGIILARIADNIRSVKTNFAQRRALLLFEGVVKESGPSTDVDGLVCINSNTASNFLHVSYNKQTGKVLASLPPLATLRDDAYIIGQPIKAAVYYDADTGKIIGAINGNVTEATTTIPDSFWNSLQFMNIGSYYLITNRLSNSETKRVCYSNASFNAAELALLTK